jgi:hypothetical protein
VEMGKAKSTWIVGVVFCFAVLVLAAAGCGEVTPVDAEQIQACAKKDCDGADCPPRGQKKHDATTAAGAGGRCAMASGAAGGATGHAASGGAGMAGAAGGSGGAALTDAYDPGCALCARAEACCKAEGLTDCNYAAACANASNAEKAAFYVAFCRMVLDAASSGKRTLPDVCGM